MLLPVAFDCHPIAYSPSPETPEIFILTLGLSGVRMVNIGAARPVDADTAIIVTRAADILVMHSRIANLQCPA
jgi:hypothetical protein